MELAKKTNISGESATKSSQVRVSTAERGSYSKRYVEQTWHHNKLICRKQLKWFYGKILCKDTTAYMEGRTLKCWQHDFLLPLVRTCQLWKFTCKSKVLIITADVTISLIARGISTSCFMESESVVTPIKNSLLVFQILTRGGTMI